MEYSPGTAKILKKQGIETGHRVRVAQGERKYEGVLMPNTGDPSHIVIKLDSGYNVGIAMPAKIEKIGTEKPKAFTSKQREKIASDKSKPTVSLIATGGTITAKIDYATGGASWLITPEELVKKNPEIGRISNIEISRPFVKASEDMTHEDWVAIAKEAEKQLNKGAAGAIITHGTDTLHYTSAALSFMLKTTKPVVIVGSQRSSDRGSTDSAMNLLCAAHAAMSDIAEVGICMHATMNDDYCYFMRGTKVRKMHASRRDAFRPINAPPLARIFPSGHVEIVDSEYRKRSDGKTTADTRFEPRIALQKVYPGSDPEILDYLASNYRGIVLEATGFGHVPTNSKNTWIPAIKRISERIPVVVATQTIYGRVNPNVYTNLRILFGNTNAIPAEDMHPETAFIKLGFVLGHAKNLDDVGKMMLTNIAGEITGRDLDSFLI